MRPLALILALLGTIAVLLAPAVSPAAARGEARLVFMGDVMVARFVNARLVSFGFDSPFTDIRGYLEAADLAIGNLEGPIVPIDRVRLPAPDPAQFNLTGDARAAHALRRAGFDLLSVANNHTFDAGVAGLQHTVTALQGAGIEPLGLDGSGGQKAALREASGVKIAFLAYNAVMPNVGSTPLRGMPYVTYLNPSGGAHRERFTRDVAAARREADVVVVMIHWGTEYQLRPDAAQKRIAEWAGQAGVDLLVGAHPHVVQGMALRVGAGRSTLVAYSLGNALFDQSLRAETRQGFALDVLVDKAGLASARLVPIETRKRPNSSYVMQLADDPSGRPTLERGALSTDAALLVRREGRLEIAYRR